MGLTYSHRPHEVTHVSPCLEDDEGMTAWRNQGRSAIVGYAVRIVKQPELSLSDSSRAYELLSAAGSGNPPFWSSCCSVHSILASITHAHSKLISAGSLRQPYDQQYHRLVRWRFPRLASGHQRASYCNPVPYGHLDTVFVGLRGPGGGAHSVVSPVERPSLHRMLQCRRTLL